MKKIKTIILFCSILLASVPIEGEEFVLDEGFQFRPLLGIWFGPVTPAPGSELSNQLTTNLGGGIFFRINLPFNWLHTEIGTSFSNYSSAGTQSLDSIPIYGAMSYKLPFNMPIALQAKAGAGANYFSNEPEGKSNTLPMLYAGFELSFPAGKWVNIGIRVDYFYAIENFVPTPSNVTNFKRVNGHFLNFGLMVNFNWVN